MKKVQLLECVRQLSPTDLAAAQSRKLSSLLQHSTKKLLQALLLALQPPSNTSVPICCSLIELCGLSSTRASILSSVCTMRGMRPILQKAGLQIADRSRY